MTLGGRQSVHGWSGRTEALTDPKALQGAGHHLTLLPCLPDRTDQNGTEDRSPGVLPEGEVEEPGMVTPAI